MFIKHGKIIIIFNFILLVIFGLKMYQDYHDNEELKKIGVLSESSALAHLTKSFRKAYQDVIVNNHIKLDEKTINLLPVKTSRAVSEKFSSLVDSQVHIRTVSDTPRNIINQASDEEIRLIQYFRDNPSEISVLRLSDNGGYIYGEPLYVKPLCLKCHGKREDAPKLIRDNYDGAYEYKVGDIRGLLSINYMKHDFVDRLDYNYRKNSIVILLIFASMFIGIIILVRNINAKDALFRASSEKQKDELRRLSITDHLTGMHNRYYYDEVINKEMQRAKRNKKYLVYAMFDLDHFKHYNDIYGHQKGDLLLQKVSSVFHENLSRTSDFCFRLGGEEFLALYTVENEMQVITVAEKIREGIFALNVEHVKSEPFNKVTSSGGIAIYSPDSEVNEDTLYARADNALYKAKSSGRNQIVVFEE
ncbi:diguanylate cyclase [bacterium]|nr:diguanylate cyclase [bacterium]